MLVKEKLVKRAKALKQTRDFFDSRGYLEADVPIFGKAAAVDAFIDLFEVNGGGYLHSSPELRMKDLLCNGSGNIYFLGHVFRKEEEGSKHNEEFTMLEYYRTNTNESEFLSEMILYLSLFLGKRSVEIIPYLSALEKYTPPTLPPETKSYSKQELEHFILSHYVEPNLGQNCFSILTDFPPSEASLAKVVGSVAKRYEIFANGTELGNGFFELSCADTARSRFLEANEKRLHQNKPTYPLDETFLKHLSRGLPENTYGIAIGFDRLLMLAQNQEEITNVLWKSS
jgi:lysyl-tRNA synthetase class 2